MVDSRLQWDGAPPVASKAPGQGPNGKHQESGSRGTPKRSDSPKRRSRAKKKSLGGRLVWLVVAMLLLGFAGDAAYSVITVRSSLESSVDHLSDGRVAIEAGDLSQARASVRDALREANAARDAAARPALAALFRVPLFDRDIRALRNISAATETVAAAGLDGIELAEDLGVSEEGLAASLYDDGVVRLEALEDAQPEISMMTTDLAEAEDSLRGSPRPLTGPLQDALGEARNELNRTVETSRDVAALFSALPEFFGGEGPRRYLLAFQASGESRGTGGVIGLYGVLDAKDGRLELGDVGHFSDIFVGTLAEPVDAPGWFERSYGPQYALRQWPQANSSPNFPAVSQVLLEMYETGTGESLDGVVAMDPLAMQDLMRATGPLQGGRGDLLTAENVDDLLLHDSYLEFDNNQQQTKALARYVREFWEAISAGDFNPASLVTGMAEATRTRHLAVFSRTSETQDAMSEIGASGEYAPNAEQNVQMVFHNNYAANKVDFFLRREVRTSVRLSEDGQAAITTEITMRNLAPDGPPSVLLGPAPSVRGAKPGLNRMLFNFLAPKSADFEDAQVDGTDIPIVQFRDRGFPVLWDVIEIAPGETVTASVRYRVPNAISVAGGAPRFQFRLVPQPLPTPAQFSFIVDAPAGLALAQGHPDTPGVPRFRVDGTLDAARSFDFVLVDPKD